MHSLLHPLSAHFCTRVDLSAFSRPSPFSKTSWLLIDQAALLVLAHHLSCPASTKAMSTSCIARVCCLNPQILH